MADLPKLKNPVNPVTRKQSPQSRLYKKIQSNLEKIRKYSSDNDSKNLEQSYNQNNFHVLETNDNKEGIIDSEMDFKTYKIDREKSKECLNTVEANFNCTIDENIMDFEDEKNNEVQENMENVNKDEVNNIIK